MYRPLRIAAVVLLSFSLGLHWAVLQSVAWTSMFLSRVQHGTVVAALQTTFDGKHPCPICLVVRDGRAAERQEPAAPGPAGTYAPKLDLTLASSASLLLFADPVSPPSAIARLSFHSRSDPPPLPPPRTA